MLGDRQILLRVLQIGDLDDEPLRHILRLAREEIEQEVPRTDVSVEVASAAQIRENCEGMISMSCDGAGIPLTLDAFAQRVKVLGGILHAVHIFA